MSNYRASIIIPCYNKEKYLARGLNSLVALSRFNDFEIIVINDGSNDNSLEIAQRYESKYPNISVYSFDNGSGSASKPRNFGIEKSTTQYLIFMDPDDEVINDGYSTLLNKMEEYNSDILIAARIGVSESGYKVFTDFIDPRYTYINENSYKIKLDLLNRRPFILKTIYSKQLIQDNGIRFNEKISTSEDESFDMQCVAAASKITKINDVVYRYTAEAEGSITTNISMKIFEQLYDVLEELSSAYQLLFSNEIIAERLISLIDVFYIRKVSQLNNYEEMNIASNYIYSAVNKFGTEKFDCLIDRNHINLFNDIKKQNIDRYIIKYLLRRISIQNGLIEKDTKKIDETEKLLNRKIVKPGILLAKKISKIGLKGKKAEKKKPLVEERSSFEEKFNSFIEKESCANSDLWLFMDRYDNAKDNGEALYRYVKNKQIHENIAFILSEESNDYGRLIEEGFNIIQFASLEHWCALRDAEYLFTSHCDEFILKPWYYDGMRKKKKYRKYEINIKYKLVFLQHGVIRSNLSGWLGNKDFYKIVASSPYEKQSLLNISHYNLTNRDVILTGLPRWDNLRDDSQKYVTIFPTWRKEIDKSNPKKLERVLNESTFVKGWIEALSIPELKELIEKGYSIRFVSHRNNVKLVDYFKRNIPDYIEVVNYNDVTSFSDLVVTSTCLITDYSSFSFDFLYLNKPVIYYDFEENALKNNYKNMEYEKYGYYCTELMQFVEALKSLVENNFSLDSERLENINKLLPLRDGKHCEHVISEIENAKAIEQ